MALQSLAAVAAVAKRRMPANLLSAALDAIDPILSGEAVADGAQGEERAGGALGHGGVMSQHATERRLWVAGLECLAALAQAGAWDSDALDRHGLRMIERLLLALGDADPDDSAVREAALAALEHVAAALADSMYPFLPLVMPHVRQALEASQGLEDLIYGSPTSLPLTEEALAKAMEKLEHEHTSTCEEKTNAARALAVIAEVSREHFADYIDQSLHELHAAAVAFQPEIRRAAFEALPACVAASISAYSADIRAGPASCVLHSCTESHADAAMVTCLLALEDDDDTTTVAAACHCLAAIADKGVGWPFLRLYLKRLAKRLRGIMDDKAECSRKTQDLPISAAQRLHAALADVVCALSRAWALHVSAATRCLRVVTLAFSHQKSSSLS